MRTTPSELTCDSHAANQGRLKVALNSSAAAGRRQTPQGQATHLDAYQLAPLASAGGK